MTDVRKLALALAVSSGLVCNAGLAVELAAYSGWLEPRGWLRSALSLSYEGNLPTWYSSGLLWTAALGLFLCGHRAERERVRWWVLAALFMLMSLDEAISLHEELGGYEFHGVLYFSWVVPGALLVASFAVIYLGFWRRLPPPTRRGFAWAFVLYVGGALGMEFPLGAWYEAHGDRNLGYSLIDAVEESLEICGLSVFLVAILRHLMLSRIQASRVDGAGAAGRTSASAARSVSAIALPSRGRG
jgi:hypothetical protein